MRSVLFCLALLGFSGAVAADVTVSIPLVNSPSSSVMSETYSCSDGNPLTVQYVNSGANALAIIPLDCEDRIFVNVVSGSGATYVSGASTWSTKGESAMLETEMESGNNMECELAEGAAASE